MDGPLPILHIYMCLITFFFGVIRCVGSDYEGVYAYNGIYESGFSTSHLSGPVIGSVVAFGVFLVIIISACRQCGCCDYPPNRGNKSRGSNIRPQKIAVIDTKRTDDVEMTYQVSTSALPGLPSYLESTKTTLVQSNKNIM